MTDIEILTQLLNGYHLNANEVIKANEIIKRLKNEVKSRIKNLKIKL